MSAEYVAVIEKESDSAFGAWFPDVEGCFSAGDTLKEAVANAAAALRQHREALESAGRHLSMARTVDDALRDNGVRAAVKAGAMLVVI